MNDRPSYQALLNERNRFLQLLADWPPVLRGSIRHHGNKCGNPHCRCRDIKKPVLYGLYHYLSHRYGDFGNRSLYGNGQRNHEVLMSLIQTARQVNPNPLTFLYLLLTQPAAAVLLPAPASSR